MLLKAPKGMRSVSVGGEEYKVKKGLVEVPDELGPELFAHGLTVAEPVEPDEVEPDEPETSPPATKDENPNEPDTPPVGSDQDGK